MKKNSTRKHKSINLSTHITRKQFTGIIRAKVRTRALVEPQDEDPGFVNYPYEAKSKSGEPRGAKTRMLKEQAVLNNAYRVSLFGRLLSLF